MSGRHTTDPATGGCCSPSRGEAGIDRPDAAPAGLPGPAMAHRRDASVSVDAGAFLMGTDDLRGYARDGEGPVHEVELAEFLLDVHTVTNDRFGGFV
ncbi:MAG: SUMF1/EgtB/PvdO family nonheme iron enzyme, partial [Microbacterium sp.]